jgi:gamma-glutamylcyclotransferase (GGCT)/AIG2-like uncharacterized protein YtfP
MGGPHTRLAAYGTLAPGRVNHHLIEDLSGTWAAGSVRGRLLPAAWGAHLGLPGLVLDQAGDEIAVQLFTSPDLPAHWARLDEFEGVAFRRVETVVRTGAGALAAQIYVLVENGDGT